jgi:transcriptional regulator with XRE-family HTH domain
VKRSKRPDSEFVEDQRLLPLARAIRAKRKALKLSLRSLATAAGVQFGHLSRFELGQGRALSVRSLLEVMTVLDLTLAAVEMPSPAPQGRHQLILGTTGCAQSIAHGQLT